MILPFILFIDIESLFNLIFFLISSVWYLSLQAVGVGLFTYVYTQLILFSFSGLQCQIIVSCCCHHQLYLAWRNSTLDSHAVSCYFIWKGNLSYFYGNMSATIDFKYFPFQIGGSNAVVVLVHHSSFGHPLTCLSSSISSISLHQLWVIYSSFRIILVMSS